jgi:type III secretory pathway component EscV
VVALLLFVCLQDFRQGSSGDGGALLSAGAIAGIAVGVVLGLLLLAGLLLLVVRQRQRRRTAAAAATATLASKQDTNTNDVGRVAETDEPQFSCRAVPTARSSSAASSTTYSAQHVRGQAKQHKEEFALDTSILPQDHRKSMGSSDSGVVLEDKRWVKLTNAIGDKVLDIHKQRLKSALLDADSRSTTIVNPLGGSKNEFSGAGVLDGMTSTSYSLQATVNNMQQVQPRQDTMASSAAEADPATQHNLLKLKEVIGQGSFGTVYR